jgi:4-carboxymuconolactone decarboxylase
VGAAAPADWSGWTERGEAVCRTVYGGQYEGLRGNVRALHPDMEQWMVTEGYGKVLGRPGLDLATRELCVVALLAVAVAPAQLYSHLRGALNAGASPEAVEEALAIAARASSDEAVTLARETWRRVRRRPSEEGVG